MLDRQPGSESDRADGMDQVVVVLNIRLEEPETVTVAFLVALGAEGR